MDPIHKLLQYFNREKSDSTNYRIAQYILQHLERIESLNITTLADLVYVSPATITRFIQSLGFETFSDFKQFFKIVAHSSKQSFLKLSLSSVELLKQQPEQFLENYVNEIIESLEDCAKHFDFQAMDHLIDRMMSTDEVAILGYGDAKNIAQDIQLGCLALKKVIDVADTEEKLTDIIENYSQQSLIVILTNYGNFFNHFKSYYQQILLKKIPIILVTQNFSSMETFQFEDTIYLNSQRKPDVGNYPMRLFSEYIVRRMSFKDH